MTYQLRYLEQAKDDLVAIQRYITRESGSSSTGRRFVQQLRQKCREIAGAGFQLGIARPELLPNIRSYPFGHYVIFMRYSETHLEIVSVIEGHRDMETFFS